MGETPDLKRDVGLAQTPLKDSHLTLVGFGSSPKSGYYVT